jgi:23S rRNA pseudouridine1911/1915/1917 synthase
MSRGEDQIFRVLPRQTELTLSAALREWLPDKTWSQIRKLLRARQVMVSGNLCTDAGRRLKIQDVVKVLPQSAAPLPREHDIRIEYLDTHVVVVEKPAGLTSTRHAEELSWPSRRRQIQPTLDELLPQVIARAERRGAAGRREKPRGVPPPVRPVHRIDRETSGLMVFARTIRAERHLGLQFREHTTYRRYLAIAEGRLEARTIESSLVRDRGDGRRGSTDKPGVGKRAITHVTPLEHLNGYTLVECRLETGRTHQIRIHLAELGHPLCGERIYRQPMFGKPLPDRSGAPRVALHAAELGFEHPMTGKQMRFKSPLPKDLDRFLEELRRMKGGEPKLPG